jgi:signal transduction histidine kinase
MIVERFASTRGPWIAGAVLLALVGGSLWAERNVAPGLMPHGVCYTWLPSLVWLHVGSDLLIGLAYLSIPFTLAVLVRRRSDLPFNWVFALFGVFIVACGVTHFMEVLTIWQPVYWLSGAVKAVTAAASVPTAGVLVWLLPRALELPTVEQLRASQRSLEAEVERRRRTEAALRDAQAVLEERVAARTRELADALADARAAHAEAEAANAAKDRFLATVSHELRAPLQATLSWVQVLRHPRVTPGDAADAIARIDRNVRLQARLTDDLLDSARIRSGKLHLAPEPDDPRPAIERALEAMRPLAAQADVALEATLRLDGAPVMLDAGRFEQVIVNLLSNALKFTPAGGRVALRAEGSARGLSVEVTDTGAGIEPEALERIFEPFAQGAGGPAAGGLGLGLSIARGIVAGLGGTIEAASDGPGRGARFSVRLPPAA